MYCVWYLHAQNVKWCEGYLKNIINFTCHVCSKNQKMEPTVESTDKLCHFIDMISAEGGEAAIFIAKVWCRWNKFRKLISLPTMHLKGRLNVACDKSADLQNINFGCYRDRSVLKIAW